MNLKYGISDMGEINNNFELIFQTGSGEKVYRNKDSIIVKLPPNRNALTTSWINGGYHENLEAIFNHQIKSNDLNADDQKRLNISEYLKNTAIKLGLHPEKTSGLITSADMQNVAIFSEYFEDIEVTAIITGGIAVNGGRAGDPASFYEKKSNFFELKPGTINTILIINANLHESTLLRAVMTAVEAKTVALQELMAPSKYSTGIATGSGTDKISIISSLDCENVLTIAGKHSKLGELIARCVIKATKAALAKQTNLTPEFQRDMMVRLERFAVDEEMYWRIASSMEMITKETFLENLHTFSKNSLVVATLSSILHILDEIEWNLIPEKIGKKTAISLMKTLPHNLKIDTSIFDEDILNENDSILNNWIKISSWCIIHG
ncbi:adenosylcobinamide amidohydrolase [Methanobacterium alcaliphilum]|uniref:adenosylcobinamide amidohydrolase n=1 Tax=Methanobacterium alcaliphilum TaxID=392018 RepID=UPI00200AB783|nr:adenosylcobinamide amidohydrolase [Methanobacterium alcaliphilum]MCK9151478.1 adenosylcobinamide amidohydrolase [Methanobacterium alcaliphilum]